MSRMLLVYEASYLKEIEVSLLRNFILAPVTPEIYSANSRLVYSVGETPSRTILFVLCLFSIIFSIK